MASIHPNLYKRMLTNFAIRGNMKEVYGEEQKRGDKG